MSKTKRNSPSDDLPTQLEYLRAPALALVGNDRQIVGCGQVDFGRLERAIRAEMSGLSSARADKRQAEHRKLLRTWLADHEQDDAPLATGLRFVALLLEHGRRRLQGQHAFRQWLSRSTIGASDAGLLQSIPAPLPSE